jgi:hypothetical protein
MTRVRRPEGRTATGVELPPIWNAACEQAGVPGLHFHDLSHVGGTLAAATGASLNELTARHGHSSTRAAMICQHAKGILTRPSLRRSGLIEHVPLGPRCEVGEGV